MAGRYVVFFLVALLLMGGIHWFLWARLVRDTALPAPWGRVATIVLGALFAILMSGFVAVRALPRAASGPLLWVGYTWLGILFFLFLSLLASDAIRAVTVTLRDRGSVPDPERRLAISRLFGGAAALVGLGASAAGVASALGAVSVVRVRVPIARLSRAASGTKIVQISDVHVGPTIGKDFIETIVAQINALEPDVVAITGDLVDGSVRELGVHVAPLASIRAKHGVYFVTGNHEYYSGADDWILFLESLGVRVLRNEHVRIGADAHGEGGFVLAGIDDPAGHELPGHGPDLEGALPKAREVPIVLLAHQPRAIHRADALGVDLQLSGHTHGGQIFPWNFLVRLQQPFIAGLHKLAHAHIYVSRGTGYWGPPMRLGAPAEITAIELVARDVG